MPPVSWNIEAGQLNISGRALRTLERLRFWRVEQSPCALPRWIFLRLIALAFLLVFAGWCLEGTALIGAKGLEPVNQLLAAAAIEISSRIVNPLLQLFSVGGLAAAMALLINFQPRRALYICCAFFFTLLAAGQSFVLPQLDFPLLGIALLATGLAPVGRNPGLALDQPVPPIPLGIVRFVAVAALIAICVSGTLTTLRQENNASLFPTDVAFWLAQLAPVWVVAASGFMLVAGVLLPAAILYDGRVRTANVACCLGLQFISALSAHSGWLNLVVVALGMILLNDKSFAAWQTKAASDAPPVKFTVSSLIPLLLAALTLTGLYRAQQPCDAEWAGLVHFEGSIDEGASWRQFAFRNLPQQAGARCPVFLPCFSRFEAGLQIASSCGNTELVQTVKMGLLAVDPGTMALFQGDVFEKRPALVWARSLLRQYDFAKLETPSRPDGAWQHSTLRSIGHAIGYDAEKRAFFEPKQLYGLRVPLD